MRDDKLIETATNLGAVRLFGSIAPLQVASAEIRLAALREGLRDLVRVWEGQAQGTREFLVWLDTPAAAIAYPTTRDILRERFQRVLADQEKRLATWLRLAREACSPRPQGEAL